MVFGKGDEKYKRWKISLALDKDSQKVFDESECQLRAKRDDGKHWYTFSRNHERVVKDNVVHFDPPEVVDFDGNPTTEFIGNGSKVTIRVALFDTSKGKGHRLEKIRIDSLVPYTPDKNKIPDAVLPPLEGVAF